MTRSIFTSLIILFLFTNVLFANHKVAVGIEGGVLSSKTAYSSEYNGEFSDYSSLDESNQNSFEISPFVGIMAGEVVEIRPGVTFRNYRYKSIEKSDDSLTDHYQTKAFSFGANVGSFFHLIRKDAFHLSIGPKFGWQLNGAPNRERDSAGVVVETPSKDYYDSYSNNEFDISAPMNLDFHIGKVFGIKLSFNLIGLNIQKTSYERKDSDTKNETTNTSFMIMGSSLNIEGDNYPIGALFPKAAIFFRF